MVSFSLCLWPQSQAASQTIKLRYSRLARFVEHLRRHVVCVGWPGSSPAGYGLRTCGRGQWKSLAAAHLPPCRRMYGSYADAPWSPAYQNLPRTLGSSQVRRYFRNFGSSPLDQQSCFPRSDIIGSRGSRPSRNAPSLPAPHKYARKRTSFPLLLPGCTVAGTLHLKKVRLASTNLRLETRWLPPKSFRLPHLPLITTNTQHRKVTRQSRKPGIADL